MKQKAWNIFKAFITASLGGRSPPAPAFSPGNCFAITRSFGNSPGGYPGKPHPPARWPS